MTRKTDDPRELDAMLRRAHVSRSLFAVDEDEGPDEAPVAADPVAPKPGPLAGGAAAPSLGMGAPDPDKVIRAMVDQLRHGVPMPGPHYLQKDA